MNEERHEMTDHQNAPCAAASGETTKRGWKAIVGKFSNDPLYEKVMESGRAWRESQREPLDDEPTDGVHLKRSEADDRSELPASYHAEMAAWDRASAHAWDSIDQLEGNGAT